MRHYWGTLRGIADVSILGAPILIPRAFEPLINTKTSNVEPRERPYKLFDGGGLCVEVMADGRKLWRFKYIRPSGSESRLGFGADPTVFLAQVAVLHR